MRNPRFILFFCFVLTGAALHSAPLDYKVFSNQSYLFFVQPTGLTVYSINTRDFRTVILDKTLIQDNILDVTESDGLLYLLMPSGIYQLDMGTNTMEKLPFPRELACDGKLASDLDYVWLSCPDTLMQFDKLSREWLFYRMKSEGKNRVVAGAFSNGDQVFCAVPEGMRVFTIMEEKWKYYPAKQSTSLSAGTRYLFHEKNLFFIDNTGINRFVVETRDWETVTEDVNIKDGISDNTYLYYLTGKGIFSYEPASSISQRFDIPSLENANAMAKLSDSLFVISANKSLILYDLVNKSVQFIPYGPEMGNKGVEKLFYIGNVLLMFSDRKIGFYDFSNKLWEVFPRQSGSGSKKKLSWNNEGLSAQYTRGYSSTLKGSVLQELTLRSGDYNVDTTKIYKGRRTIADSSFPVFDTILDSSRVFYYNNPTPKIDLTLHNAFPGGRYLDAYFNNTRPSDPARKNLQYRGNPSDIFQDAILGKDKFEIPESQTLPKVNLEGGAGVWESPRKLKSRDRKVLRVSAGAGFATTRTIFKVLPYSETGKYRIITIPDTSFNSKEEPNTQNSNGNNLENKSDSSNYEVPDTTRILPGSLQIWVDGEKIDSSDYTLVTTTGDLKFQNRVTLDPQSVIKVAYQEETIPEGGVKEIELLPVNRFSEMGYVDVHASFTDWFSTRAAYVPIQKGDEMFHLAHLGAPIELRRKDLFLKANPEFTYDGESGAMAGALGVQSRLWSRASLGFKGLLADTGFSATDNLTRGYGNIEDQMSYSLSYDLFSDWTVGYNQENTHATAGEESRYEAFTDIHFPRFPALNVGISRNSMDAEVLSTPELAEFDSSYTDSLSTTAGIELQLDTLDKRKDKLRLKLYETSSYYIEKALHLDKFGYEVIHTEFTSIDRLSNQSGNGRILYARASLSPIKPVTLTSVNIINRNPEGSKLKRDIYSVLHWQTINAPKGLDISGNYEVKFKRYERADSSLGSLDRSVDIIMMPGTWFKGLAWLSPRGGISQRKSKVYSSAYPGNEPVLLGDDQSDEHTLTKKIGIQVFPYEDMLFRNMNTWESVVGSDHFRTFNDLKLWFNSKRALLQTRYEFFTDYDRSFYQKGYIRYDNVWQPWLTTTQGLFATFDEDSLGTKFKIGPGVTLALNMLDIWMVKKLMNSHNLNLDWYRSEDQWVSGIPGISYLFNLRLNIKPNIYLNASNAISLVSEAETGALELDNYSGKLTFQAFF